MKEIDDKIVDKINKADEIKEFEEEEDVYLDELYCAACNKNFKTSMALVFYQFNSINTWLQVYLVLNQDIAFSKSYKAAKKSGTLFKII